MDGFKYVWPKAPLIKFDAMEMKNGGRRPGETYHVICGR